MIRIVVQDWKDLDKKQLDELSSGIKLNELADDLLKNRNLALELASYLDSKRVLLSEMEGKYFKFLDSGLQSSLMDIQDYLEEIRSEFRVPHYNRDTFKKALSKSIEKVMKEIAQIREKGVDIGF